MFIRYWMSDLPPDGVGGAIVYCATRRQTEELAEFLQLKGVSARSLPWRTASGIQEGRPGELPRR